MKVHKVLFLIMCLAVSCEALGSGGNQELFQKIFELFSQTQEYNNIFDSFQQAYRQPKQTAADMLKLINNIQLKAVNGIKTVDNGLTVKQQAKAALYVLNRINNQILLNLQNKKSKTKKASNTSDSEMAIGKALAANALQAINKKLTSEAALQKIETGKIVALESLNGRRKIYYGVQNLAHLQDLAMNDLDYWEITNEFKLIHAGKELLTEEQFQAVGWDRLHIIPDKTGHKFGDEAASAQAAPAAAQTVVPVAVQDSAKGDFRFLPIFPSMKNTIELSSANGHISVAKNYNDVADLIKEEISRKFKSREETSKIIGGPGLKDVTNMPFEVITNYRDVINSSEDLYEKNKILFTREIFDQEVTRQHLEKEKTGSQPSMYLFVIFDDRAPAQTIQSVVGPVQLIVKINMILGTAFNEREIKFTASNLSDLQEQINRMIAMGSTMTPDDYQLTFDGRLLDDNVWKELINGCTVEMNDSPGKLLDYLYKTLQKLDRQAQAA